MFSPERRPKWQHTMLLRCCTPPGLRRLGAPGQDFISAEPNNPNAWMGKTLLSIHFTCSMWLYIYFIFRRHNIGCGIFESKGKNQKKTATAALTSESWLCFLDSFEISKHFVARLTVEDCMEKNVFNCCTNNSCELIYLRYSNFLIVFSYIISILSNNLSIF